MFKTSPFMEKIFFIFTLIAQGSSFLRPSAYALMHRDHHKYSDTKKDPHSPTSFKNIFSFMIKTANEYKVFTEIAEKRVNDKSLPRWDSFEKFADSYICRTFFVLLYISIYIYFSPYYWLYLLIPVHILMGPLHGFIVNWFGHKVGYRNFDKLHDKSKNTLFIDFLMLGELYQNNHHRFPKKNNFAFKWYEIDFGYKIVKFLHKIGIITITK
tara:strand:- start:1081 stop:1716 length:636 start_codon:yes stop_codon:yes gene_type:complete